MTDNGPGPSAIDWPTVILRVLEIAAGVNLVLGILFQNTNTILVGAFGMIIAYLSEMSRR